MRPAIEPASSTELSDFALQCTHGESSLTLLTSRMASTQRLSGHQMVHFWDILPYQTTSVISFHIVMKGTPGVLGGVSLEEAPTSLISPGIAGVAEPSLTIVLPKVSRSNTLDSPLTVVSQLEGMILIYFAYFCSSALCGGHPKKHKPKYGPIYEQPAEESYSYTTEDEDVLEEDGENLIPRHQTNPGHMAPVDPGRSRGMPG